MKKLLLISLCFPLLFNSCKKEDQTTNNSSLSLENTVWEMTKIEMWSNTYLDTSWDFPEDVMNDVTNPDWGYDILEWIFLDNILIFHSIYSDQEIIVPTDFYDTVLYTYQNNIISTELQGFSLSGVNYIEDFFQESNSTKIIEYNSNSLKLEINPNYFIVLEKTILEKKID